MQISEYVKITDELLVGVLNIGDKKYVISVDTSRGKIENHRNYSKVFYDKMVKDFKEAQNNL